MCHGVDPFYIGPSFPYLKQPVVVRPRLHEQIKPTLIAEILDLY